MEQFSKPDKCLIYSSIIEYFLMRIFLNIKLSEELNLKKKLFSSFNL